jgi:hypothetical protein
MGAFLRNSILIMFVWMMMAGACFGKQVYMNDGSIIACESFWRHGDKVVVKINRDTILEFAKNEINERRTFAKPVIKKRQVKRKIATSAVLPAKAAAPADQVTTAQAAPAPQPPTQAIAANPEPAPAQPAPAAEKQAQPEPAQPTATAPAPAPVQTEATPQEQPAAQAAPPSAGSLLTILLVVGAVTLLIIATMWVIFTKAGQAGWKSLVPIYNMYILLLISGVPGWWLILLFIPLVGIVVHLLVMLALAKKFGKGTLFGIGLFILPIIFYPLLAFGGAQYEH